MGTMKMMTFLIVALALFANCASASGKRTTMADVVREVLKRIRAKKAGVHWFNKTMLKRKLQTDPGAKPRISGLTKHTLQSCMTDDEAKAYLKAGTMKLRPK